MQLLKELPALGQDLSPALIFISLISLTAVGVGCFYPTTYELEMMGIRGILCMAVLLCMIGLIFRALPQNNVKPRLASSIASAAFLWGFVGVCGAIPFMLMDHVSVIDGLFESMSSWTGTGFTVAPNVEQWPHCLLFWRSLMQWVGGLGIIAFTLTAVSKSGFNRGICNTDNKSESFLPSVTSTALQMWKIYLILTVIAVIMILCTGVTPWDAVNLAFCAISTGGLTMYADGIAHYANFALEIVLIPIMLFGAVPFRLYYLTYTKKSCKEFLQDPPLRLMIILFIILSAIITLELMANSGDGVLDSLRKGLFMASSAVSSTGFQNTDFTQLGLFSVSLLATFMLIGGPQGSTSGGLKLDRIITAFESLKWWVRKSVSSSKAVVSMRHNKKAIKDDDATMLIAGSSIVSFGFILLFLIGTLILLHDPYFNQNIPETIFDVMSCIGNNGCSSGVVGPDMPDYAKILFFFMMWFARLEIIPIIILISGLIRGFSWK